MPVIEHPNILFCLFDSLSLSGFDELERTGELPVLSRLRKKGIFFSRCYTPCPESSPARASLFTGLDPAVHGLWTNGVALPEKEATFAQLLKTAGYLSYLAGRSQLAGVSRWTTEQVRVADFEQVDWAHGPLHRSRQNMYLRWLEQHAPKDYSKVFAVQANPARTEVTQDQRVALTALPDGLSFNNWVGERTRYWISQVAANKPFLAVAGFSVGDDLGAEPQLIGDGEDLNKVAMLQCDAAIGRLIEQLQASDRAKDTVIVIASARGNCNPEDIGNPMIERCIKVPLLIYNSSDDRKVVDTPVSTVDIAPTVMKIANVVQGPRMQGRPLLSISEETGGWAMSRLRSCTSAGVRNWKTSLCVNNMKLVVQHSNSENSREKMRLFNLKVDPLEQKNLAIDETNVTVLEDMIDQMIDARCALEDRTEPRVADF